MNIPHTPPRRRFLTGILSVAALVLALPAAAATYLQTTNHNGSGDWNVLTHWKTSSGVSPSAITSSDDFVANTNAWQLRTPSGTSTFGGKSLTLGPGTHSLVVRSWTSTATVPNLTTLGSARVASGGTNSNLAVTSWHNASGTTALINHTHASAHFPLAIGTLTGSGDFHLTGSATGLLQLTLANAHDYLGTITLASGRLEFMNAASSAGALIVANPGDVILDHDVTFTGLTVNGTTYSPGTYSADTLGFEGDGSVTVRTAKTWYLTTNQTGSQNWTPAYVAQWKAYANGSGATAPSINILDTYSVSVGSNALRTPTGHSTFTGGTLAIGGSAKLVLAGGSSAISTVPRLSSTGGVIDAGTASRNLSVDRFTATSGAATLTAGSGGVLNFFVGELQGSGNFTVTGSGQVRPFIDQGNGYTGTFTVNNGATLNVQTKFGTAGKLVVNSGGNVALNDWVYVTGLTVNGSVKPVGTYNASQLGSGFSGSGSIAVYTRDTDGPAQMFGVNLAGADFKDDPGIWQTNPATWDYYKNKGLTLIRLPVKWRRITSTPGGNVTFSKMDECIDLARARGMKVILDLHDYGHYHDMEDPPMLGTTALPISALVNVWSQIADHYKDDPAIYGYDLMNEPQLSIEVWADAAQQTVDAIRKKDRNAYVLIEGIGWAHAHKWSVGSDNGSLDIKDPVGRLIYSAHSYWDYQSNPYANPAYYGNDGGYRHDDVPYPQIGVVDATPFVEWLQTRPHAYGNIGEYAVTNAHYSDDWNEALGNFLAYLRANNLSATYWAGGNNWTFSDTVCHPQPFPGADKPQMAVLQQYNNHHLDTDPDPQPSGWSNQDIGNTTPAGTAIVNGATVTIEGAGADIWGSADAFHYVYQPLSGDGEIIARAISIENTHSWARGGPMIREGLSENARHFMVRRAPDANSNTTTAQWRDTAGGNAGSAGNGGLAFPWMRITRVGDVFTAYRSSDGVSWSVITTRTIAMTGPVYIGIAMTSHNNGTLATGVFDNVSVVGTDAWANQDVGNTTPAGTAIVNGSNVTIEGAGADIWGADDAFHYVYQPLNGDAEIIARAVSIENTHAWARGGPMIRESLDANARHVMVRRAPGSNGTTAQWRSTTGGSCGATSVGGVTQPWMRLTRVGNVFTAYRSADGVTWDTLTTQTIPMSTQVYIGLAMTSHNNGTLATGVFDNVSIN